MNRVQQQRTKTRQTTPIAKQAPKFGRGRVKVHVRRVTQRIFNMISWKVMFYISAISLGYTFGPTLVEKYMGLSHEDSMQAPPHPHRGATTQNGKLGYKHDVYFARRTKYPRKMRLAVKNEQSVCEHPPGKDVEGRIGYLGLSKIQVVPPSADMKKVLCIVYTHSNRHDVLENIVETYGQRCDGFLAASNVTDQKIGAVNILHEGPESYDNMWQKVRSTFAYVHDHYLGEFDFFHIGGKFDKKSRSSILAQNICKAAHLFLINLARYKYRRQHVCRCRKSQVRRHADIKGNSSHHTHIYGRRLDASTPSTTAVLWRWVGLHPQ